MTKAYATPAGPLRAITEELLRGGIRDVVICPGSRSTPLALALHAAPQLRTWVHLDERSGAFFALGAAKAGRRPTAVLATSGTAVVNFAPAVTEARYGRVPLVLLTANRPPELHGIGSPQTIDQAELYGRHAKWYVSLPVPDASAELEAEVRGAIVRAVDVATSAPAGPVQVDLPFREPLLPQGPLAAEVETARSGPAPVPAPSAADVERVADALARSRRPLLVVGPLDEPGFAAAAVGLAQALRAPLLADGLSNVREGAHDKAAVIAHHDALLHLEPFWQRHRPDLVLRFGATPTSKVLGERLDVLEVPQLLVDDGGGWDRPRGPARIDGGATPLAVVLGARFEGVSPAAEPGWLAGWRAAEDAAASALEAWFEALREPFEGSVPRAVDAAVPDGTTVVVGNSMPVRDLDDFAPLSQRTRRLLGNRGANGIDGVLSTALGAAAVAADPVVAVVGDLSFLHDLNALVAARRLGLTLTVVLVNNDGGGIFSFLPQASAVSPEAGLPDAYEALFGTPHGIDFGPLVGALGGRHRKVDQDTLPDALRQAATRPGLDVLELRTERRRNVELHRGALAAVARAVEVDA